MTTIFFDIETIGTTDPDIIAELAEGIKPPGNLKKQESIDKWMAEERQAAIDEKVARTAFDPLYGRIVCIGWVVDDDPVPRSLIFGDETDLLIRWFEAISAATSAKHYGETEGVVWVGHNIAGFDLPFLRGRAQLLGEKPPRALIQAMNAKPWDKCIGDTMLMWNADRERRVSLDRLCRAFGIASPKAGGVDGSQVRALWDAKEYGKIAEYCRADVEATRSVYRRLRWE